MTSALESLPGALSREDSGYRGLVWALRAADAALAAGDAAGAVEAMDRPAVWRGADVESMGRLAEASLSLGPSDPLSDLRRDLALGTYLNTYEGRRSWRFLSMTPLPGLAWDEARHQGLVASALAALQAGSPHHARNREAAPAPLPQVPEATQVRPEIELASAAPRPQEDLPRPSVRAQDELDAELGARASRAELTARRRDRSKRPTGRGRPRRVPTEIESRRAPTEDSAADSQPEVGTLLGGLRAFVEGERQRQAQREGLRLGWRFRRAAQGRLRVEALLLGEGTRPIRLPSEAILAARDLAALPQDRAAMALLAVGRSNDELPAAADRILFELAGHPRVSWVAQSGTTKLEVVRGRAELAVIEPEAGVLGVALSVDGELKPWAGLRIHDGIFVEIDEARSRAIVVELNPILARLISRLPRGFDEAVEAGQQSELLDLLASLEKWVPISWRAALKGPAVPANDEVFLLLEAAGASALSLEIRVRPLVNGPSFPAGAGLAEVVGRRVDASVHHALRDFEHERNHARSLAEKLPEELRGSGSDEGLTVSWMLLGQSALELVAFCQSAGLPVEWAGDPWEIHKATDSDFRIQTHDGPDWFGLTGELTILADRVRLALLLAAGREERKFVQLGAGRWAELSAALQRTLGSLADFVEVDELGCRVARELAPLLDELDDGIVTASPGLREVFARVRESTTRPLPLDAILRPYQREGARRLAGLAASRAGALLADDMGLGKTIQAITTLLTRRDQGPALVVAPASVGFNWVRELERFAPELTVTLLRAVESEDRARAVQAAGPSDVLVASYDLVVRDVDELGARKFSTLILDEAQVIKNPRSRRARAAGRIDAAWKLALSGTPLENRLADLWSIFRVVSPGLLGPWGRFRERFAAPIERGRDAGRMRSLTRLLAPFVIRRTKAQVAPELPPKTEVDDDVLLSPRERALYEDVRLAAIHRIAKLIEEDVPVEQRRFSILGALTQLRQACCHPRLLDRDSEVPSSKEARLVELVLELKDEGRRALVFSQFVRHLALVKSALEAGGVRVLVLDGSTPSATRARHVDEFQRGDADVFLISLKAGGVGLNLTAADAVIHLDPWWNPAVEDQASDRAHRIGQTRPVTVFRLVARGTIEDSILQLHAEKRGRLSAFLEGVGQAPELELDELVRLLGRGELPEDNAEADAAAEPG